MSNRFDDERRALLRRLALGLTLVPMAGLASRRAHAADPPLLSESDPAAKALDYVEDAAKAKGAQSGSLCSNCSIYGGADGATAGPCTLFPGKWGKANGWCKSWSGL